MRFSAPLATLFRKAPLLVCAGALSCSPRALPAGHTRVPATNPSEGPESNATRSIAPSEANGAIAPSVPPSKPLYAEIPADGTAIGEPGGIALAALSNSGHWTAFCASKEPGQDVITSRRGEPASTIELALQMEQQSEAIDALLRFDESGRYLVVQQRGSTWLVDALESRRWDLADLEPDLRNDALPDHRSFAFGQSGLFVLNRSGRVLLVPLPLGGELTKKDIFFLESGERPIWRLETAGPHLMAHTLLEGSDEGSWPVPASKTPQHRCASPHRPYRAFSKVSAYHPLPGREVAWLYLEKAPLTQNTEAPLQLEPTPGFVMPFRRGWVRRLNSGRLMFVEGNTQKQIASERCGARIHHAHEKTGLFLISCEKYAPVAEKRDRNKKPQYRFDLYLVRPGYVRSLHADVARTGVDVRGDPRARFSPLRPGATAALVDFEQRQLFELPEESFVIATGSEGALIRRKDRLWYWTPSSEKPLEQEVTALTPVLQAPGLAVVGRTMYRLEKELETLELQHSPLFITASGHSIVPREAGNLMRWPRGPLLLLPPKESEASTGTEEKKPPGEDVSSPISASFVLSTAEPG